MLETVVHTHENSAEFKRLFRDYEDRIAVSNSRRAALLAAIFMLGGCTLDYVVFPELANSFLLIRIASFVLLGSIFLHLGRIDVEDRGHFISAGIALIPLIAICAMIVRTGGGNSEYYAGLSLVLVGLSLLLRWSFRKSLAMISVCLVFYALSVSLAKEPVNRQILFNNSYFLFVTSVFVVAGSYFYEQLRFREFALRNEVEKSHELLESQNKQLSELDEAKTHFFANISHELRTPLTIMLGITERLKASISRQPADAKMTEMTQMLEQNGLRLLKLIDDLLDLVRFDTGHTDINTQATAMDAHLDGLLLSLRHLAEQDRVSLVWEGKSDVGRVMLDRDKFDKILLNLVINAIKFTPSRGVIDVKVDIRGGKLLLTVEDTGVGIAPHILPRIFERFWQVDTSSTRKFQGAGIGLALVRSLTQAMEGEITVDSQPGVGTKFTVNFPVETASETTETEIEEPLKHGGKIADLHRRAAMAVPGKIQSTTPSGPTGALRAPLPPVSIGGRPSTARPLVLIADDEPDIRRFLRMQLEDVDVIEAADGAEAFQLAQQRQPQLALLDQMMPEMDGVEACRRIRENHTTRSTAIIILTARADEQTKLNALQAGANDFLTKPFSTAELSLRLSNQLAMARIRRELLDLNTELQSAIEQIKENEVAMVRNEKLSSLGRMSAGIIHEINNPLNYATAGLHALATFTRSLPDKDQEDFEDILKDIREGVERVSQIVIDLRQFTREDNGISGDADLTEVIARSQRMVSHQVGKEISFKLNAPPHAMIRGNANQLVQVFVNFFQNSIDAINERPAVPEPAPGQIEVTIEPVGEGWTLTVRDNGVGIPPENLQKIFDPFFTSKDVGKGMGLGLSITHQILQGHGAIMEVDSRPSQYTVFRLTFPGVASKQPGDSALDPVA
ncbi:ATP-binding protein [Luteolibacter sp. SL250]|uniref:ATP-binding response regulator n=1 Tax=Luteolibacter sp. SL250 TaxID=2995170 RepID=UPI00226FF8C2|nr:ATP-binding protein [Luteolibacter sp. SL250]WAC17889.1 ATP-binding protein [Luteolibacter sp. SL250]